MMALLAGLVLAGVIVYLLMPKTETTSTGSDRGKPADRTALSGNGNETHNSSASNDSALRKSEGSSNADDSSGDLSGIKTTLDPAAADSAAQSTPAPQQAPIATLPLVFQKIDPRQLNISSDQQEVIDRIKQHFLDMVGGANQDPTDPQYLRRWQAAQPLIDDELKTQLGQQFFLEYERRAGQSTGTKAGGSRQSE